MTDQGVPAVAGADENAVSGSRATLRHAIGVAAVARADQDAAWRIVSRLNELTQDASAAEQELAALRAADEDALVAWLTAGDQTLPRPGISDELRGAEERVALAQRDARAAAAAIARSESERMAATRRLREAEDALFQTICLVAEEEAAAISQHFTAALNRALTVGAKIDALAEAIAAKTINAPSNEVRAAAASAAGRLRMLARSARESAGVVADVRGAARFIDALRTNPAEGYAP